MASKITIGTSVDWEILAALDAMQEERGIDSRAHLLRGFIEQSLRQSGRLPLRTYALDWRDVTANDVKSKRRYYRLDAGYGRVARLEYDGQYAQYNPSLTIEQDGEQISRERLNAHPHDYAIYVASQKVVAMWPDLDPASGPVVGLWAADLNEILRAAL